MSEKTQMSANASPQKNAKNRAQKSEKTQIPKSAGESAGKSARKKGVAGGIAGSKVLSWQKQRNGTAPSRPPPATPLFLALERQRALPHKNCNEPGLKQQRLGTPKSSSQMVLLRSPANPLSRQGNRYFQRFRNGVGARGLAINTPPKKQPKQFSRETLHCEFWLRSSQMPI